MKKWLFPILVALVAVLANWQGEDVQRTTENQEKAVSSIVTPQDDRHHEATFTDATSLYRICNTRPQRVVPTYGSHSKRTTSQSAFALRKIVEPLKSLYDSRRRQETAPFRPSASCDYYILALRHIIR